MTAVLPDIASLFPTANESGWRQRVEMVLKGADFDRKLVHRSLDGIAIKPLSAFRSDAPLVTGAGAARRWATSARVDHPDAEQAAQLAREDLEGGADMLTLVFPAGRAARGFGLPCDTVADLDAALAGVQLELIRLRLDPAPAGRIHALTLAALVEARKLSPAQVNIDFSMDPMGSLLSLGHVPWDWAAMAARLGETVLALKARGFAGPFLTVDLRPWHEAGASEGQELAAGLAMGVLYLRALEAHGVPLAEAFSAISFVMPMDADQFMGIAKVRALRKLWDKVAVSCEQQPMPALVHAETSWRMLTRRDAHVNILRATIGAFAAGAGGADTLTVLPFTQALGLADAAARRLARNTSIVLLEEANLWRVADPAAGAGSIEDLTDALSAKAWALFQEIEGEGGMLVSLALGKLQARVAAISVARRIAIATRRDPITGVSVYADLKEVSPAVLPVKPGGRKVPKARAKAKFGMATEGVILALLAGASRADAAPVFAGEFRAEPLVSARSAEPFEALRDRADAQLKGKKRRPAVILATLGPLADHGPRLQFMTGLFEVAGFATSAVSVPDVTGDGLVCIIGTDAAYAAEGTKVARKLRAKGRTLWVAGKPGELEEPLRKAGIKRFVAMGDDMLAVLDAALAIAGA